MSELPSTCRCPTCDARFDPRHSSTMPFCSQRCRQIDLGRWLREQFSVPVAPRDDEDEYAEEPPPPPPPPRSPKR